MKKMLTMILALTMVFTLAACGGEKETETADVDLNAFYGQLAEKYDWVGEDADPDTFTENTVQMMDLTADPEIMEGYYAGLNALSTKQLVAQATMISFAVNEYVFVQCENEDDAAKAAEILQNRINNQIEGGAMYPMSIEVWEQAQVVTHGNYVALIATGDAQAEIVDAFNALFA